MRKKEKVNYVAIGLFIFLGIVLFLVGIYFAGKYSIFLGGDYLLNLEFEFLDDLPTGAYVRIAGGINVGKVYEIKLEGNQPIVVISIDNQYKINRNATFHIFATSLVGMKYIDIQGYDPEYGEYFEPGEYIEANSPMGMSLIFESLGSIGEAFSTGENMDGITSSFKKIGELIDSLNELVVDNKEGLNSAIDSLTTTLNDTESVMRKLENTIDNLENVSETLNGQLGAIESNEIESIVNNIDSLTEELNKLATDLNSDDGVLSLLNDPEFAETLENTMNNLESFSETIKDKPNAVIFGD